MLLDRRTVSLTNSETVHEFPHSLHHAHLPRSLIIGALLPLRGPDWVDSCGSLALDAGNEIEIVGIDPGGLHIAYSREIVSRQVPNECCQARDLIVCVEYLVVAGECDARQRHYSKGDPQATIIRDDKGNLLGSYGRSATS